MTLQLYAHPFSSYCQKVLTALYENNTPFRLNMLDQQAPDNFAKLSRLWPIKKFPVLVDDEQAVIESSIIIEHLALYHPGPIPLIPSDPRQALDVRFMDRYFDNYVMTVMQKPLFEALRSDGAHKEGSRPRRWCKSGGHGLSSMLARAARHAAGMRRGRACGSSLNWASFSRLM
jgi:glutathione S-transferase